MTWPESTRILAGLALLIGSAGCGASTAGRATSTPTLPTPTNLSLERDSLGPPGPLPTRPLEFPPFRELALDNGLRMILVEQHEQPVVAVDLFIESGAANEPPEVAGLAAIVAELLTKGTPSRTAEEISRTIEGAGGDLSSSAAHDYLQVSSTVLADGAELAFEVVSDVVLRPSFPAEELEITRTRTLTSLQAELAEGAAVAARRFMSEIYGANHPYRLAPLPQTIRALDRDALLRFHADHFKADNALLVVAGDIDSTSAVALAEQYFGDWAGGGAPDPEFVSPPRLESARILLAHRPGSVQSSVRIGHLAIHPDNPDYYPLQVLHKILGAGADSRLFLILREQKGWTYGTFSELFRPRDIGFFAVAGEVRNEVTDSTVVEILHQLERIRDEPVPETELAAAKSYLVGSFPLSIETPGQIARQLARSRLLGLPFDAVTAYRDRIEAVTVADVQRVAREYVHPEQAAIVVVGDATQVLEKLDGIAPVTLSDIEGNPLERSSLEITSSGARFDAARLTPGTMKYRVLVQGNPFGTATTNLSRDGGGWTAITTVQAGPLTQTSELSFGADLTPISATSSTAQGGVQLSSQLRFENGRIIGRIELPEQMGGARDVDTEAPAGTLFNGMDAFALASADLEVGETIAIPIFSEQTGTVVQATLRIEAEESVAVAAGTFEAYRVEMSAGPQSGTLWVRREAPHVMVKQEVAGQPVVIELEEM
jgi:zinc protease